ncbi:hypothetical protein IC575_025686 [Cucumis melo]
MCELHEGNVVSNKIRWLAHGPNCGMVNGYSYHTKSRDDHRTVQNSGIMLVATTMQMSRAKDKNPMIGDMSFYGIIEDIWEVSYNTFNTVLFKCKWVENENGVRIDDLHFTLVDLSRIRHSSDSFIIATYGQQVFYVSDLVDPRWSIVVRPPQKDFSYKCANDDLGDMLPHYPQSQNGIQQVTLMKVGMHALDLTVKANELPLNFHAYVGFVVDPRSKKTIIQNASVCFRQFKYRLTTTYVLPFLDDVEKLKFPSNEYSFIDQQHWTEFVASRLKEDFKDELVATQNTTNAFGEKDILTRALGCKDRPGIFRSVGKYVTKKKYFHTATQQKTNEKEDDKATSKEHDRMGKRIKELEEELFKMKE